MCVDLISVQGKSGKLVKSFPGKKVENFCNISIRYPPLGSYVEINLNPESAVKFSV